MVTSLRINTAHALEHERTLIIPAATAERGLHLLLEVLGSAHNVTAVAFDPEQGIALRLTGLESMVDLQSEQLLGVIDQSACTTLDEEQSKSFWRRSASASCERSRSIAGRGGAVASYLQHGKPPPPAS